MMAPAAASGYGVGRSSRATASPVMTVSSTCSPAIASGGPAGAMRSFKQMDLDALTAARREDWDRLAQLAGASSLTGPEADELIDRYQAGARDLSAIRTTVGQLEPGRASLAVAEPRAPHLHRGSAERAASSWPNSSSHRCRPRCTGSAGSPSAWSSRARSSPSSTRRLAERESGTAAAPGDARRAAEVRERAVRRVLLRASGFRFRRAGVDPQRHASPP